uniref:Uncharacterized protein n=1 Tax=Acrobeloides nanus TaxID=290746 RepID=A0A914EAT6_9BILA
MHEYRKYMIWNSSQAFTTIIALNIAELVSIFPCPAVLITGPARYFEAYFGLPAEWVEISLFLGNTVAYTYISMVMFLYRHQQLSDGWLKCYMEQNRYALPGNAIGMAVGMILTVTSLIGYVNGSDVMKGIFGSVIEKATDVQNVTVIGFLVGFRNRSQFLIGISHLYTSQVSP